MTIGIPTPLPPSIKAYPSPWQASFQVPKFSRALCCKSLDYSPKAKFKQGDYCQDPKREVCPVLDRLFETCSAGDPPKENSASELWLYSPFD